MTIPPTGCEDFDDYVEDGRVAADRDAQREQARRFEEMSGCDFCNAQEREIARLTKELAEAQNTIGEMEEQCSTLESERNQINREREKARDAARYLYRTYKGCWGVMLASEQAAERWPWLEEKVGGGT